MSDTGPGIRFRIGLSGPSLTQTRRADFSVSAEILLRFTFTFTRVTVTLREGLLKNKFVHNAHVTHSYRLKYDCETGAVLGWGRRGAPSFLLDPSFSSDTGNHVNHHHRHRRIFRVDAVQYVLHPQANARL